MGKMKALLAGLGGAIALNLLHESLKHKSATPNIDELGEEALEKTLHYFGTGIDDDATRYAATLGADVVSNALYYSAIGAAGTNNVWSRALSLGITAGIGAVTLPEPLGLDDRPVAQTTGKQVLTVGYYVFGAMVTAGLLKLLKHK